MPGAWPNLNRTDTVNHAVHWADGGASDRDNLVLLCHQHHHDLHDRERDLPHHDGLRWLTQTGWGRAPS